jgi:beta-lactamase regulating signal transducer with metallopeptidase domain
MTGLEQGFVTVASALSAIVLNALWQDALLVVCVWLLLRAWPKINAATRYAVWSATLIAAFIVPIGTTLAFFETAPPAAAPAHNAAERARLHREPNHFRTAAPAQQTSASFFARRAHVPSRLRLTLPAPAAIAIFFVWLGLAAFALTRLAIGLMRLEQLKRDALPLPVGYRDAMPQWLRANKGARDVRLCVSDETDVPVAVGLFDAMILIPRSLLDRLSEPEVDQICLHELAHLRRGDDWTNSLQRVISALLGWNPAVLFIGQQLDLEREVACDDWVVSFVRTVRAYALCLTKMAETASWPRSPIPAPGVFATRKHISLRIERLLRAGRNVATNLSFGPTAAAVATVGAIALLIAFVAPSVAAQCVTITVPPIHVYVPPTHVEVPARHISIPETRIVERKIIVTVPRTVLVPEAPKAGVAPVAPKAAEAPRTTVEVPSTNVEVPAVHVNVPGVHVDVPKTTVNVPNFDTKGLTETINKSIAAGMAQGFSHASSVAQATSGNSCDGCNYQGQNLAGADLHGRNFSDANFKSANLEGVNFSGSSFDGTSFADANLSGASFRNAHLSDCDFSNANLNGVDFTGARLTGCSFKHAHLSSAQLRELTAGCEDCDFDSADSEKP